ncbi:MAG TPA: DUF424 domain-containing protein [Nitrosopumilaceae archaeon]|nr:DUF424 domain-containing protein [Nitrosopumilaceae archaeon]HXV38941.1 DUF424 domain-containing protein [Nitrosopumilaceae archaeon]
MSFAVKTITYQQNLMLNICDADLVGRIIKKEDFSLNISKSYFADRFVEKTEAEELLKKYAIINLVGKETISLSINLGIGSLKGVKEIDGVPFLLVFKF